MKLFMDNVKSSMKNYEKHIEKQIQVKKTIIALANNSKNDVQ